MKNLDRTQKDKLYNILLESRKNSKRTVLEVCVAVDYDSRGPYYSVVNGSAKHDDIYIKMALASGVPYKVFTEEYLPNCNIQLDAKCSVRNKIILGYFADHSTENKAKYEIDELNMLLKASGVCRL